MSAVMETLDRYSNGGQTKVSDGKFGLGRWLSGLFGCPHKEMSRPFSRQGETYRVCINCGAQRGFDENTWNFAGPFYFKPARTSDLRDVDLTALRCV
ncbi:MAG: hypothetical protein M3Y84_04855 [Acidobacteriota bacterium]|nr:hypothetical protein [Acidobacteriota bacterium]